MIKNVLEKLNFLSQINIKKADEKYLRELYKRVHGKDLEDDTPRKFSEKIFLRLIDINLKGNLRFTKLADKLKVRDHISETIGKGYLVPLLWSGKDPSTIPFHELPNAYVIKANHGSAMTIVVRGDIEADKAVSTMNTWLVTDYSRADRENHYAAIEPRILIEELLDDGNELGPLNYSFWNFGERTAFIQVDNANHSINPFYDLNWNKLDITSRRGLPDVDIAKPQNLSEMIRISQALSKEFEFVRVDLYNVNGKIYFGELTFTPGSGRSRFIPEHWDTDLGELWIRREVA